ncbi:hypothetical protein D3C71_1876580 [compost metagenome]
MRLAVGRQHNLQAVMKNSHITHLRLIAGFNRGKGTKLIVVKRLHNALLQLFLIHLMSRLLSVPNPSALGEDCRYLLMYPLGEE